MRTLLERHLQAATPVELALWSLRGLTVLDPRLEASLSETELLLKIEDRPLSSLPVASLMVWEPAAASSALAVALGRFYQVAWAASSPVRRAGMDRVIGSGFDEVFNHLDPYSRYVTPAEAETARERRVGQSGLGLRIAVQGRALAVVAVTPSGPAALEGVRIGDRLVAVDGRPVGPRDPGLAATLLEGEEGTTVTVTLIRASRRP